MRNYDEALLRGRRLLPAAPWPLPHQALRIALYDEYAARAFRGRVIEAFGPRPPFEAIQRAAAARVDTLAQLCLRFGVPQPLDPFPQETTVEPAWLANCERAVAGELASIGLYEQLELRIAEPALRRAFADLRNQSLQRHLPVLVQVVQESRALERYHAAHGIPPQQAYTKHGALSDLLERLFAQLGPGGLPLGVVSPLLQRLDPALLAGMVTAGTAVYLWRHQAGRNPKEV